MFGDAMKFNPRKMQQKFVWFYLRDGNIGIDISVIAAI
jgi:hypothetical protein